jgi:hypothetical protein
MFELYTNQGAMSTKTHIAVLSGAKKKTGKFYTLKRGV